MKTVQMVDTSVPGSALIVFWQWTTDDAQSSNEQHPEFTFAVDAEHDVTLLVRDARGVESEITKIVDTTNIPPTAQADYEIDSETPTQANFTDESFDVDGNVVGWSWEFYDDGENLLGMSDQQNPEFDFNGAGNYTAVLVVEDDDGAFSEPFELPVEIEASAEPESDAGGYGTQPYGGGGYGW